MEKFFYLEQSPYTNKYMIRLNHNKFLFPHGTAGSYNVFLARLVNLHYADYLRYCRDRLGAELIGKNARYVVPYFENTNEAKMFVKLLNARMEYVMNEHDFPYDFKEVDGEIVRTPFSEYENNK